MFPSWIRSRNCRPRLVYFFAMETTKRRLASINSFLAWSASASPRWMKVRVRLSSVSPTSLASSISFSSPRRSLKRLQPLDGAAHLVDEPLLFKGIKNDGADGHGNFHAGARHFPLGANIRLLFGFRGVVQLHRLLQSLFVQLRNLVDVLQGLLGLVGNLLFGEFFVVKHDDFFDGPGAFAQILPNGDQFL